jgi:hypothetical protein
LILLQNLVEGNIRGKEGRESGEGKWGGKKIGRCQEKVSRGPAAVTQGERRKKKRLWKTELTSRVKAGTAFSRINRKDVREGANIL